jgi:cysteine-rich repeat protein
MCKNDCTHAICGDSIVGPGETCDDGNTNNNDICNNLCQNNPYIDLSLEKNLISVENGYTLFEITVNNKGDTTAKDFKILDYIPANGQIYKISNG